MYVHNMVPLICTMKYELIFSVDWTVCPESGVVLRGQYLFINCTTLDNYTDPYIINSISRSLYYNDPDIKTTFSNGMYRLQIYANDRTNGTCYNCIAVEVNSVVETSKKICIIVMKGTICDFYFVCCITCIYIMEYVSVGIPQKNMAAFTLQLLLMTSNFC